MNLIYFAKPEEMNHMQGSESKLGFSVIDTTHRNRRQIINCRMNDLYFSYISGLAQGESFVFDFIETMIALQPKSVVMCGICAGNRNKELKLGDVIIGETTKCLSGKLSSTDFNLLAINDVTETARDTHSIVSSIKVDIGENKMEIGTYLQSPFVLDFDLSYLFTRFSTADRRLLAVDMESWFYMNSARRMGIDCVFPVVKGISDVGVGKTDNHHMVAIHNAFKVCLTMLEANRLLTCSSPQPVLATLSVSTKSEPSTQPIIEDSSESEPEEPKSKNVKVAGYRRSRPSRTTLSLPDIKEVDMNDEELNIIKGAMIKPLTKSALSKVKGQLRSSVYNSIMKLFVNKDNSDRNDRNNEEK